MQCDDRADACTIAMLVKFGRQVTLVLVSQTCPLVQERVNFGQVIVNNTQRCCDISAGELVRFA